MGLFGLFGRKKEVELDKVKDDNKEKFLREQAWRSKTSISSRLTRHSLHSL